MALGRSVFVFALAAAASPAIADRVVFQEGFDNATRTAGGQPNQYTISGTHSWWTWSPADSTADVAAGVGNAAPGVVLADTSTSTAGRLEVNLSNFAQFDTTQPADATITFSVDMRVDEYASGTGMSNFRFVMKDGGRANPFFAVGFTRALSEWNGRLFLFAGDTGHASNNYFAPGQADAIGWDTQNQTWAEGFNFGTFSTADAALNDTNDEFYRLQVTFKPFANGVQEIEVVATQLSTGNTASLTRTVTTPYVFSNDLTDGISINAGGSSRGTAYFDNVRATVTPEPSASSLLGLGALAMFRLRQH